MRTRRACGQVTTCVSKSSGPGRLEIVRAEDLVAEVAGVFDGDVYPDGYRDGLRRDWP